MFLPTWVWVGPRTQGTIVHLWLPPNRVWQACFYLFLREQCVWNRNLQEHFVSTSLPPPPSGAIAFLSRFVQETRGSDLYLQRTSAGRWAATICLHVESPLYMLSNQTYRNVHIWMHRSVRVWARWGPGSVHDWQESLGWKHKPIRRSRQQGPPSPSISVTFTPFLFFLFLCLLLASRWYQLSLCCPLPLTWVNVNLLTASCAG